MQYINRLLFEEAIEESGEKVKLHGHYSGRAMFGERCLAVYGSITNLLAFHLYLGASLGDWRDLAEDVRIDQFGTDYIAYYPGWELAEDDD
ncbi:hypothetical protein [Glycomyces sp. NPDC048151]|uniref:hypothetical protein n=1 Tax=Glycomyces sp. NPDC048151 TaxID=3364002 RepID=UPI00371E976A